MSYRRNTSPFDSILGVVVLVAFLAGLFFLLRGLFWILSWVAPVLLLATLIIDKSVVINYGKWIYQTLRSNPLLGIGAIIFTIVGYMIVFPFLFIKAIFRKKIKDVARRVQKEKDGELIDFEELESKSSSSSKEERIEMPKLERRSEYDKMFD
jgi:Na+-transporting methylmalonyl-CoA/oxaloacetate decarboxylase gamma subunit